MTPATIPIRSMAPIDELQGPEVQFPDPDFLVDTDDEPIESAWRRAAIALLIEVLVRYLRPRTDYYVGGNMFIYYDSTQVRTKSYRGPDFFFVNDVDGTRERPYWAVWLENGRYPNVIGELLSPTTAGADRTTKKQLYERVFHTAEYFLYDPAAKQLEAYRLGSGSRYQPITANDKRRFWLEELGLWIGTWVGPYLHLDGTWPRFYDAQGQLLLTGDEHQTAEQAELAALKARLAELEQK